MESQTSCHCCSSKVLRENEYSKIVCFLNQLLININGLIMSDLLDPQDILDFQALYHVIKTLNKLETGYYLDKIKNNKFNSNVSCSKTLPETLQLDPLQQGENRCTLQTNMALSIELSNQLTKELMLEHPSKFAAIKIQLRKIQQEIVEQYTAAGY